MTEGTTMPAEREAIVQWLRERSDDVFDHGYHREAEELADAADAIERGDHLKESAHE